MSKEKIIHMKELVGTFAENKDIAREVRIKEIMPDLFDKKVIVLDFEGVTGATQSFIHALIAAPIREYADETFEYLFFKNCNDAVQEIIKVVADYLAESIA